jgi:Na+-translocating ferredoxin:NAD+ oxidoreductase RnfC subunit
MTMNLVEKVKKAGIVGAGGAGFPTHVKIDAEVEYVLINGAECEPLLRSDQQLIGLYAKKLWEALEVVVNHTGAKKGIIVLKQKYHEAVKRLQETLYHQEFLSIHLLDDFYPAGDEHVLLHEVTGRVVPERGIPLQVGCVVLNVETLLNIWFALRDVPVCDKYITITGEVEKPLTIKAPIGAGFQELMEMAGGPTVENPVIIEGGPMMGKIQNPSARVTKTTGGIIVLSQEHYLIKHMQQTLQFTILRAASSCCQCRACTDICPRYLLGHHIEPHKIMRLVGGGSCVTAHATNAFLCSECSACDKFGCPMDLSPVRVNKMIKQLLTERGIKNPHELRTIEPNYARQWRKIPGNRLIARLGLTKYDVPAPLIDKEPVISRVSIPLSQHIGRAANAIVQGGEMVQRGQLIGAMAENTLGANIHASISGMVEEVSSTAITIKRVEG